MILVNKLRAIVIITIVFFHFLTYGENYGANTLWVCQREGKTAIVSAKEKTASCQLYKKGILGRGSSVVAPKAELVAPQPVAPTPSSFTSLRNGQRVELRKQDLVQHIEKQRNPQTAVTQHGIYLYYCPDSNGGSILEASTPPASTCRSLGKKASKETPSISSAQPTAAQVTTTATANHGKGKISIQESDSPPEDIYKCFDENGRPTYVSERDSHQPRYRHCRFFSRSFASVQADFQQRVQQQPTKSLTELASQGLTHHKDAELASIAVRCVGAGQVEFNGLTRQYNCATRSFDLTPGSSGGEIVLGQKSAIIAAHNLDYFNARGSCGGSVTSSEGRILHFSPTKDCPTAVQIEAREIEKAYIKTISVTVSGAFLNRQKQLSAQINQIAQQVGIDPFLVHAIISAESAYKTQARSRVGAMGLMQLMPATAKRFGVTDAYHTGDNIRGGSSYLKFLLNKFNGNYQLAIAGYNAGEGNVIKYGYKIPPFIETRAYVPKVMEYYRRYKANPGLIGLTK